MSAHTQRRRATSRCSWQIDDATPFGRFEQPAQYRDQITRLVKRMPAKDVGISAVECRERIRGRRRKLAHLLDSIAREQQLRRIDVAAPNEASGLASAPAGIGLIHEPALVVHEAVQIATRPRESLPKVL